MLLAVDLILKNKKISTFISAFLKSLLKGGDEDSAFCKTLRNMSKNSKK